MGGDGVVLEGDNGDNGVVATELTRPPWPSSSYTIGLGLHSLEANQEAGSRMMEAELSIQHPEYNKPFIANDLMLIKLKESVSGSDTIQNISIASQCPTAGDSCLVSGWGQLMDGELLRVTTSALPEQSPPSQRGLTQISTSQVGSPKCSSA